MIRAVVRSDPAGFVGVGAFCYGGIIAIPCYAFVGSLMVLTTKTARGQRAGEIFAATVAAVAWIAFLFAALNQSPQMFVAYSLVVIAVVRGPLDAENGGGAALVPASGPQRGMNVAALDLVE